MHFFCSWQVMKEAKSQPAHGWKFAALNEIDFSEVCSGLFLPDVKSSLPIENQQSIVSVIDYYYRVYRQFIVASVAPIKWVKHRSWFNRKISSKSPEIKKLLCRKGNQKGENPKAVSKINWKPTLSWNSLHLNYGTIRIIFCLFVLPTVRAPVLEEHPHLPPTKYQECTTISGSVIPIIPWSPKNKVPVLHIPEPAPEVGVFSQVSSLHNIDAAVADIPIINNTVLELNFSKWVTLQWRSHIATYQWDG